MTSAGRFSARGQVAMYPAAALQWPRVVAQPARAALDRALAATGRPVCAAEPEAWLSDNPEDREIAALYCPGCPVISECRAAGRTEHFGVWAGEDRTPIFRKGKGERNE